MGTGPRLRSSSVSRVCFISCKKFKGNFTMALCSFGGVSDQCGASAWAPHETGMVPLLSCENDMTEWLKENYKGPSMVGQMLQNSTTCIFIFNNFYLCSTRYIRIQRFIFIFNNAHFPSTST